MNHQPERQTALRNLSHPVARRHRLGLMVLTLSSLLLINTLFFTRLVHATPTPPPGLSTPGAPAIPGPPYRFAVTWPNSRGLVVVAFGGLLLISTVFIAQISVTNARRRDEHDE